MKHPKKRGEKTVLELGNKLHIAWIDGLKVRIVNLRCSVRVLNNLAKTYSRVDRPDVRVPIKERTRGD